MMKTNEIKPIVLNSYWQKGESTYFRCNEKIVEVTAPFSILNQLVQLCDGNHTWENVIKTLSKNWNRTSILELIKSLTQEHVICNVTSVGDYFRYFMNNPSPFARQLSDRKILSLVYKASKRNAIGPVGTQIPIKPSPLNGLIEQRCSIRTFSHDTVEIDAIAQILWAGYGIVESRYKIDKNNPQRIKVWQAHKFARHTVPSAGALYPTKLSLILLRSSGEYEAGIYDILYRKCNTVEFLLVKRDFYPILRSFADQRICNNAQGVIVVSGSFQISGEKYGNRSVLYVSLEAGHIAQNIHLSAIENRIGTVEVGGFLEEPMKRALELPVSFWPLTTILFGCQEKLSIKTENAKNTNVKMKWMFPVAGSYELPFSMVSARISPGINRSWSGGKAVDPQLAYTKAVAEAREWAACGCISDTLIQAKFVDLEAAIDPRKIIKFHQEQYRLRKFPFQPFNTETKYSWVEGKNEMLGSKVYVLADFVYFPYNPKTPRYCNANSSGVAAHPQKMEAIKNGILELVERDSFMIAYLTRLNCPKVSTKTLPEDIQKRIKNLRENGFILWVKNHSIDLAPSIFIFDQNKDIAFTTCASCSNFNIEEALDHALMEIESIVWSRMKNGPPEKMGNLSGVYTAKDHKVLYQQKKFFQKADFLIQTRNTIKFREVGLSMAKTWQELLDRIVAKRWSIVTIPLYLSEKFGGNESLHIIRSIVPGMVPISFGYRQEPCGLERINQKANEKFGVSVSYRYMTKFPHPFP
jgi:ribosomal protein S12 methylthiotransferase accessory factor